MFGGCDKKAKRRHTAQFGRGKDYGKHIQELQAVVDTMPINQYNKQSLKEKIAKKLIITKEQLYGVPEDTEIREVSGLDFLGKIHLAETAIADKSRLEVSIDGALGRRLMIGIPIAIEKTEHDAVLVIQEENTRCKEKISIAGIIKLRAFRSSFFS